jgi:hypothetical protein
MAIATGVAKKVAFKKETSFALNPPGTSLTQYLRRVTSDLSLAKATYQSNEIRPDYQVGDFRHGVRSVAGSIDGELSPGSYEAFFAALLRAPFAAVTAISAVTLSVAAASGGVQAITRSTGDFMAANIKVGMVIRATAGLNAASLNRNLFVVAVTATIVTVMVLDGGAALTVESTVAGCTLTVPGMRAFAPLTGHTDDSFAIEHWFSNIAQSEMFIGNKITQCDLALPPTGMATAKFGFMGQNIITGTSQYMSAATAASLSGVTASVNGALCINGVVVALLTGLSLAIKGNMSAEPVVGSNVYPAIFAGTIDVSGSASVMFQDAVMRDYFINETDPVSLAAVLTTGNTGTADFISLAMPRVKFGGAAKNDGQKGIIQTMPFTALLPVNGGVAADHEQSTLLMQDSLAS